MSVAGHRASLPCDLSPPPGAVVTTGHMSDMYTVYLVLWYREDEGEPLYRYLISDQRLLVFNFHYILSHSWINLRNASIVDSGLARTEDTFSLPFQSVNYLEKQRKISINIELHLD